MADTHYLGRLELCHCLLMDDSRYPWIILVPDLEEVREIYQLPPQAQQQLLRESSQVQQFMAEEFQPDKLNLGALGNIVPQLHLHHIARTRQDPAWPGPVWGHSPPLPYREEDAGNLKKLIRKKLYLSE